MKWINSFYPMPNSWTTIHRVFITLAYVLFVVPDVLSQVGMSKESVFVATALSEAVGTFILCNSLSEIEWNKVEFAIPGFLTMILMPLTYSIGEGIAFGFLYINI